MTAPQPALPVLRIGIRIAARFDRAGEFLADVRALDAAGADSLWPDGDEDTWIVLAAAAAVTGRMRLVLPATAADADEAERGGPWVLRLASLQRLSRARNAVCAPPDAAARLSRVAACPVFAEAPAGGRPDWWPDEPFAGSGIVLPVPAPVTAPSTDGGAKQRHSQRPAAGGREVWRRVPPFADRAAWRAMLEASRESGVTGVVVPFDARLVDLLRNPDEYGDRSDLQLAQG